MRKSPTFRIALTAATNILAIWQIAFHETDHIGRLTIGLWNGETRPKEECGGGAAAAAEAAGRRRQEAHADERFRFSGWQ